MQDGVGLQLDWKSSISGDMVVSFLTLGQTKGSGIYDVLFKV